MLGGAGAVAGGEEKGEGEGTRQGSKNFTGATSSEGGVEEASLLRGKSK
jgi:hypothetical protein